MPLDFAIRVGQFYKTRNGHKAEILKLCNVPLSNGNTIVGICDNEVMDWDIDGLYYTSSEAPMSYDIIAKWSSEAPVTQGLPMKSIIRDARADQRAYNKELSDELNDLPLKDPLSDGGWVAWNGGFSKLEPETIIEARFGKEAFYRGPAGRGIKWGRVTEYRIITPDGSKNNVFEGDMYGMPIKKTNSPKIEPLDRTPTKGQLADRVNYLADLIISHINTKGVSNEKGS